MPVPLRSHEWFRHMELNGVTTMVDDGRRVLTLRPDINREEIRKRTVPDAVARGVFFGYSLPIYAADNEELYFEESVPGRWDGSSDITLHILCALGAAETTGEDFNFQLSWNHVHTGDVLPATTNDTTTQTEVVDGTQFATYEVSFTLDYNVDAGDPVEAHSLLAMRLRRVAVVGGGTDEVDGEILILDWHTHYQVDKMFKAP